MAEGREIDDTDRLRIAELFLVFIVISILFVRLTKFLEHHMHGTTRRGLRHTVHHIEEELLALGVISLLLIVSEVRISAVFLTPLPPRITCSKSAYITMTMIPKRRRNHRLTMKMMIIIVGSSWLEGSLIVLKARSLSGLLRLSIKHTSSSS